MSLVPALQKSARSGEERRPLCSTSTSANPIFRPAELLGRYSSHYIIIKRFVEEALWSGRNRGSCLVDKTRRLVRILFKVTALCNLEDNISLNVLSREWKFKVKIKSLKA